MVEYLSIIGHLFRFFRWMFWGIQRYKDQVPEMWWFASGNRG
jgi:hypothetical protein